MVFHEALPPTALLQCLIHHRVPDGQRPDLKYYLSSGHIRELFEREGLIKKPKTSTILDPLHSIGRAHPA